MKQQLKLIKLMDNLLTSGFQLTEIITFLAHSKLVDHQFVSTMRSCLTQGQTLSEILATLQFSKSVVTQIALSDYHGNMRQTLGLVVENLASKESVRKKLILVGTYPAILMMSMIAMVIGLKTYLLPQLSGTNFASLALNYLPLSVLLLGAGGGVCLAAGYVYCKKISRITAVQKVCHLPFIGRILRLYLTAFYAREWGNLIKQGFEIPQILEIMRVQEDQLFQEIGRDILDKMAMGQSFHQHIATYYFFIPELALIIEYGEMKSRLGDELLIYARESWQSFFEQLDLLMNLIQPLVFLIVGLMIILIYAAMLLPIYEQMTGSM